MPEKRPRSLSFSSRARRFWQQRQLRAATPGYSGYLLDGSPPSVGRHRFEGEWADLGAWLRRHPVARGRCLDVGCGTGAWLQALAGEFTQVEGWDRAPAMVQAAARRLTAASVVNVRVRCGDIRRRKGRAVFDLIFLGGVLMYTPETELGSLLRALRRLLKPGGLLVLRESTKAGATWAREGLPLRPGFLEAGQEAAAADYVAIYRSPQSLEQALERAGLTLLQRRPNRHYKLSDLTEDWLHRLNSLSFGALRRSPRLAALAAEAVYQGRAILLYPEYSLRRWDLENYWFYCARSKTSRTLRKSSLAVKGLERKSIPSSTTP